MRFLPWLFALFVVAWGPWAYGDHSSDARAHYEKATSHFAVGEFAEAAAEYQEAFKLRSDPALLYNAAQSYRLANNPEKALILYKNYLQLYPEQPNVEEVRNQIAKLKETIAAAAQKPKTTDSTTLGAPQRPAPAELAPKPAARPSPPELGAPRTSVVEKPASKQPVYKKWWLWTVLGVAVAGGAATAVILTTRGKSQTWSNAPDVGPASSNALVTW